MYAKGNMHGHSFLPQISILIPQSLVHISSALGNVSVSHRKVISALPRVSFPLGSWLAWGRVISLAALSYPWTGLSSYITFCSGDLLMLKISEENCGHIWGICSKITALFRIFWISCWFIYFSFDLAWSFCICISRSQGVVAWSWTVHTQRTKPHMNY